MMDLWVSVCVHMEQWFDKAWPLWEQGEAQENDLVLRLTEDFFDALMAIHDSGKEDYDLQAATLEAICRMTSPSQRREFVYNWFTMDFVASGFLKIRELQFETDCRKFLNMVNGMKGDLARVYSYPCLGVFLDQHELLIPSDELEEFWIDFNVGSLSLSFYCMLTSHDPKEPGSTWETFFLPEHAVKNYSVDEHGNKRVLSVLLTTPYFLGQISGTRLSVHFSSSLNVLQAAQKVFGSGKSKVLIPDSQNSFSQRSETEQPALNTSTTHKALPPSVLPENYNPTANIAKARWSLTPHLQSVTSAKPKISKSSTFILSSSSGRRLGGGSPNSSAVVPTSTPRGKVRPALQMVSSVEKTSECSLREVKVLAKTPSSIKSPPKLTHTSKAQKPVASVRPSSADPKPTPKKGHDAEKFRRHIPVDQVLEMVQTEEACAEEPLDDNIVPDTQPADKKESSMLPGLRDEDFSQKKWSVTNSVLSGQRSNLMLSTSKHGVGSGPKPTASIEQRQAQRSQPPSAQRLSRELSPQQLHVQLTQKLEALVREREQKCTPGGRAPPAGSSRTQTARTGPGKAKAVPVVVPNPVPLKPTPTPTKAPSGKTTNARVKVSPADTSKEKQAQGTAAAQEKKSEDGVGGNMVELISRHYQITGHGGAKVSEQQLAVTKKRDVYTFNPHTPGSTGTAGKKKSEKRPSEVSPAGSSANSSSFARSASAKKAPQPKVYSRHVKKHLFSDTDTDRDRDNTTDVSWLRDSARRPKPKVVDYGRQPTKPCPPPCLSDVSPDLDLPDSSPEPPPSPEPVKEQAKPKRKRPQKKPAEKKPVERKAAGRKPVEKKATAEPSAAAKETRARRPRRAATIDVSYREESDQSEPEEVPGKKRRTSGSSDMTERPQVEVKKTKRVSPPSMMRKISPPQTVKEVSPPPKTKKICPPQKTKEDSPPLRMRKDFPQQDTKKVYPPHKKRESSSPLKKRDVSSPLKKREVSSPLKRRESSSPLKKPVKPPQESWTSRVASSLFSPPSRERMRSAEKSAAPLALSPATPLRPLCLSPIPLPSASPDLEMPKSVTGINASSFYKPATGGKDKARDKDKLKTPSLPALPALNALPTPIGRTPSITSSHRSRTAEPQLPELSPVCSLHSPVEAHLTSTALERSPEDSPLRTADLDRQLRDFVKANEGTWGGSIKYSENSMATLSQSSHLSANNVAILCSQIEKTPAFNRRSEKAEDTLHSGPSYDRTAHPSLSISCQTDKEREEDDDIDNNEDEEEEDVRVVPKAKALKMKPRKLFKGKEKGQFNQLRYCAKAAWVKQSVEEQSSSEQEEEEEEEQKKVQGVQERKRRRAVRTAKTYYTSQTQGSTTVENVAVEMSSHLVSSSSSTWKAGLQGGVEGESICKEMSTSQELGYVCQEFSTELTRKFQKRSEKMELYNKQSLKTVQQHMSSVSLQMRRNRMQRMEKVRQALLEEISSLEQDDNALKSMEKELTIYWKKQSLALHSYQEKESRRLQHLKNTFQTNESHSLEYEEQIINTEMCLMKKNMKSVQDKFLQEMVSRTGPN
ncbi:hypothetical protein ACEWY4_000635 [Coilia grayii]|uniref:Synaptonemal complex protein 2 Spt16M-like domain-containing protein n=1 Tax=Coilia grayii TaxID=363190 RepID=A0ABD1KX83_9TELE